MSTIKVDTTVTTVNIVTTGTQGPSGPKGDGGIVGDYVASINNKTGSVTLGAGDVGADIEGSAQVVQESVNTLSASVSQALALVPTQAYVDQHYQLLLDEIHAKVSDKAFIAYVDSQDQALSAAFTLALRGKADALLVNLNFQDMYTVVGAKSDKTYVDTQYANLTLSVNLKANKSYVDQVRDLSLTNELKISTKADQVDLETAQVQIEDNRLAILTKADIQALTQLALLVDTKADQSYVNQQIANIVGSAPEALNTIYELASALQSEAGLVTALNESVANRVRFDIATQALTEIQKQNARTNIDAEKIGTAQQLVSQITVQSLGAATSAQGAKADTALQSSDVSPVAFTGLFTSLGNQKKIFDVVFSALQVGTNTAISVTDTLGQMLAKLQAQIDSKTSLILGETSITAYRGDRGKTAYDHSQSTGNVHNLTTGQITTETGGNKWYTSARVLSEVLTGLSLTTGGVLTATDTILIALGKLQNQITALQTGMTWVNVTSIVGFAYESSVDTANTKVELCKFGGMLWIRGYVRFRASVPTNTETFQMYSSLYMPDFTYVPATLMTDLTLYGVSKPTLDVNAVPLFPKWNMSTTATSSIGINTSYHIRPQPLFKHS